MLVEGERHIHWDSDKDNASSSSTVRMSSSSWRRSLSVVWDLTKFAIVERRCLRTVTLDIEPEENIFNAGGVVMPRRLKIGFDQGTGFRLMIGVALFALELANEGVYGSIGDASPMPEDMGVPSGVWILGGLGRRSLLSNGSESDFKDGTLIGLEYRTSTIFATPTSNSGSGDPVSRSKYGIRDGVTDGERDTVDEFLECLLLELLRTGISGRGLLSSSVNLEFLIFTCGERPSGEMGSSMTCSGNLELGIVGLRRTILNGDTSAELSKRSSYSCS